jgi:hypothetical protein
LTRSNPLNLNIRPDLREPRQEWPSAPPLASTRDLSIFSGVYSSWRFRTSTGAGNLFHELRPFFLNALRIFVDKNLGVGKAARISIITCSAISWARFRVISRPFQDGTE